MELSGSVAQSGIEPRYAREARCCTLFRYTVSLSHGQVRGADFFFVALSRGAGDRSIREMKGFFSIIKGYLGCQLPNM